MIDTVTRNPVLAAADLCGATTLDAWHSAGLTTADHDLWFPYAMTLRPGSLTLWLEAEDHQGVPVHARITLSADDHTGRYVIVAEAQDSMIGQALIDSVAELDADVAAAAILHPDNGAPVTVRAHVASMIPHRAAVL